MNSFTYENKKYISGDHIITNAPIYSKGSRSARDLIKKKLVENTKYLFARKTDDKWIVSDGKSAKVDKVFFTQQFINSIPELNKESNDIIVDDKGIMKAPEIIHLKDEEKFKDENGLPMEIETRGEREHDKIYFKVKDIMEGFKLESLYNVITDNRKDGYVEESHYKYFICENLKKELFLTFEGYIRFIFNIRDSRTKELNIVNNIKKYINQEWICNKPLKCLYRPDMYTINNNTIILIEIDENQHSGYKDELERINKIHKELGEKDMIVIRINPDLYIDSNNVRHKSITDNINEFNKRMIIIIDTIKNVIKSKQSKFNTIYLFYNNYKLKNQKDINNYEFNYEYNQNFDRFTKIREIFLKGAFFYNLGTTEQKNMLISQIKGVSYNAIQELFSVNAIDLPCVYLTAFNTVGVLRNEMNIDMKYSDNDVVYKFGLTKSFESRKNGHKSEYKKIDNLIDMKLVQYTYIDPLYVSEAENEIKNMLEDYKINWDNHDELVVIPNNMMKFITTIYSNIGMKYSGHTTEFIKKINELELCISSIKKDQEYQKIIFEEKLNNKEHIIEGLKKDLRIKELELMLKNN